MTWFGSCPPQFVHATLLLLEVGLGFFALFRESPCASRKEAVKMLE
jgi:hypothetical protein